MLFVLLRQFDVDPAGAVVTLLVLIASLVAAVTVHEFSHALAALRLGDDTARRLGRVSLNPARHLDPMGSLMILVAGFGWGKPVPVNGTYLRPNPRSGTAIVAAAGPVSNILMAAVLALPLNVGLLNPEVVGFTFFQGGAAGLPGYIVSSLVFWNILLAVFNLLPIAPLDGFSVALGLLPRDASQALARLERFGPVVLFGIIAVGLFTNVNILWALIGPVINALGELLLVGYAV